MNRAKRLLCVLLTLCMVLAMFPMTALAVGRLPFTDVRVTDWFYNEVQFVYENGIMNGTGNGAFSPDSAVTRGMVVTILHRLEGEPFVSGMVFDDVDVNAYYGNAVAWACGYGIVNGYGNAKFGPDDPVTREQLAAMLFRYADYTGMDVSSRADLSRYADCESISDYAKDAMAWAVAEGLISGMDSTHLFPTGAATRAQTATILSRTNVLQEQIKASEMLPFMYLFSQKDTEPNTPETGEQILFLVAGFLVEDAPVEVPDGYSVAYIMFANGEKAFLAVPEEAAEEIMTTRPNELALWSALVNEVGTLDLGDRVEPLYMVVEGTTVSGPEPVAALIHTEYAAGKGLNIRELVEFGLAQSDYNTGNNTYSEDIPVWIGSFSDGLRCFPLKECTMNFHDLFYPDASALEIRMNIYTNTKMVDRNSVLADELKEVWVEVEIQPQD